MHTVTERVAFEAKTNKQYNIKTKYQTVILKVILNCDTWFFSKMGLQNIEMTYQI